MEKFNPKVATAAPQITHDEVASEVDKPVPPSTEAHIACIPNEAPKSGVWLVLRVPEGVSVCVVTPRAGAVVVPAATTGQVPPAPAIEDQVEPPVLLRRKTPSRKAKKTLPPQ